MGFSDVSGFYFSFWLGCLCWSFLTNNNCSKGELLFLQMKGTGSCLRKSADKIVKYNFTNLALSDPATFLYIGRERLVFKSVS